MTAKTRWILIITAALAIGITGALVGGRLLLKRKVMAWRAQGMAAVDAKDYPKAAELLGRYIDHYPNDVPALKSYALSSELAGGAGGRKLSNALMAYKRLVQLEPANLDSRRHLLELDAKFGQRTEALDAANVILAKSPKDLRALELKTQLLTDLSQYREALEVAEQQWAPLAPEDFKPFLAIVSLHEMLGRPADAGVTQADGFQAAHARSPGFAVISAYARRMAALRSTGESVKTLNDQAIQLLRSAAHQPDLPADLLPILIREFDGLGCSEDALALLQQTADSSADESVRATLARRNWELNRWDKVVAALANLNAADPQTDPTLIAMKGMALAKLSRTEDAKQCRDVLAKRGGTPAESPAREWAMLLGSMLDNTKLDDAAFVIACRAALKADARNPYLAFDEGESYSRLGESDLAIQAWTQAAGWTTTWSAPSAELVTALLARGQVDRAFRLAVAADKNTPGNLGTVIAFVQAWSAAIDTGLVPASDQLLKRIEEVQAQVPKDPELLLLKIEWLARSDQSEQKQEAIKLAGEVISAEPPPSQAMLIRIAMLSHQLKLGVEQTAFARCTAAYGISAESAAAQAAIAVGPLATFDGLAGQSKQANSAEWLLARAKILDRIGSPSAVAAWSALSDIAPNNALVQEAAASSPSIQGDWNVMPRVIERLRAIGGDQGIAWRLAKARLMIVSHRTDADFEQGSVLASQILKDQPQQVEAHVLLARALYLMNQRDGAIEQLLAALKIEPSSAQVRLELAGLYQSRGEADLARQQLDNLLPQLKNQEQRLKAAELLASLGNTSDAIRLLEAPSSVELNATDNLLLATLYRRELRIDSCKAIVEKLMKTPTLDAVRFAASFYFWLGQTTDANAALAELDKLKLSPGEKPAALGQHELELGHLPEAIAQFQQAVQQSPGHAEYWRLLALCQVQTGQTPQAIKTLDDAARAIPGDTALSAISKRTDVLSQSCAIPELRPVVEEILNGAGNQSANLDLLQVVTSAQKANDSQLLVSQLMQFVDKNPACLAGQMQLIIAYREMGRPSDALSLAERAETAFSNSAEPVKLAVDLNEDAGRWQQAESAAEQWKRRAPDQSAAADLAIADAQIAQGHYPFALAQLQPYTQILSDNPDANSAMVVDLCIALANLGKDADAVNFIQPLAEKNSAWRIRWMHVAVELVDVSQAETMLDSIAAIVKPDAIDERADLAIALDQIASRSHDQRVAAKATALFASVCAEPAVTGSALAAAASHARTNQDLPLAEQLYRRAISKGLDNAVTENNLADLIANRGGDLNEAATAAERAYLLQPRSAAILDTLAFIKDRQRNFNDAAVFEQKSLAFEPDNVSRKIRLASYLYDGGKIAEANDTLRAIDAMSGVEQIPQKMKSQLEELRKNLKH